MKLVPEPKWKTVHQSLNEQEIILLKYRLEDEEIPVMLFNQRDSSYNAFGSIYLQVPTELEERALTIIQEG